MDTYKDLMAKVAIAQAVYKTVAEYVSTKSDDNLRAEFDRAIAGLYDATGAKSFEMKIGEQKVGSVSLRQSKEKTEYHLDVTNLEQFEDWLLENGLAFQKVEYDRDSVISYLLKTGEAPEGATLEKVTVPAQILGTTLKIDTGKVADALAGELPQAVSNLLTNGE